MSGKTPEVNKVALIALKYGIRNKMENNVENVNFKCLFYRFIVKKTKTCWMIIFKCGNKLVSHTLCCDAPSASIYIRTTGRAVPAALAPLVSSPRVQCMMGYIVWIVSIGCTPLSMMHCGKQ